MPGYSSGNHVSGFGYDSDGNVTSDGAYSYTYDAEGRPTAISGRSLYYDAFGRAMEQNRSGTYTQIVYAPSRQKYAFMNGSTVNQYFVPLAAGMRAVYNGSGLQFFRHSDWLGSNRFSATPAGTVYYDGAYAPFGENYAEMGTTDRSFTGDTQDIVSGLYDFTFRQHSSAQGRWMVPDPAGLAAVDITNPQTWNRYAYVGNNPLNAVDPLGLYLCSPTDYSASAVLCNSDGTTFGGGPGIGGGGAGFGCNDPNYAAVHPLGCNPNPGTPVFPGGGGGSGEVLGLPGWLSTPSWGIPLPFPTNLPCPTGSSFLCGGIDPAMNITKSDWCGAGYHCDDDDIAEDCTLKATISAIGLDDPNFYTFDQLRDKAWAAGKGPLAAWLVGTAGWTAKNASKFTKLGGGLLLGYGLYTSGKSFVTTFGNCINTERGGQNYGWF